MKVIQYRYSQLGADDIRGLNGLFGASRIDQTVAVDQLMKLNFAEIVRIEGGTSYQSSTLLSFMTVKDVMACYQCKNGGSGLLSQSLFQPQKASGHGAEQVADMTSGTGSRP